MRDTTGYYSVLAEASQKKSKGWTKPGNHPEKPTGKQNQQKRAWTANRVLNLTLYLQLAIAFSCAISNKRMDLFLAYAG